jgi:phosphoglycolate phosphatase
MGVIERPQAIIFDWDNTLVDSWPTIHDALCTMFTAMGMAAWTLEDTKARVRHSLRDTFPVMFGSRWEEARRIYLEAFRASHIERLAVLPGVRELLEQLTAEGIYLAVVSNKTGSLLRAEAAHLGWNRYFSNVVGAGDASADKPDAAPVLLALEGSGIAAGPRVWFVGDTAVDMHCALNAGCVPVLLGAPEPSAEEFANHKPALVFEDCAGLFMRILTL